MSGIIELLNIVGNEKIEYQQIRRCITSAKDKKRDKCTEISFVTDAVNANDIASGDGKVGLVIWIDRADYSEAYEAIK